MEDITRDPVSGERESKDLWERHSTTRWQLVAHYLPLAEMGVRFYMQQWIVMGSSREGDMEELRDRMIDALFHAIGRFDPHRGSTFRSFFLDSPPRRPGPARAASIQFVRDKEKALGLIKVPLTPGDPHDEVQQLIYEGGSPEDIVLASDPDPDALIRASLEDLVRFVRMKLDQEKNPENRRRYHEVFDNWILEHSGLPHEDGKRLGERWGLLSGGSAASRIRQKIQSYVDQFVAERGAR